MQCYKAVLTIGSGSHFSRTADEHTHASASDFREKLLLLYLRICVMDESDFFLWHSAAYELVPYVRVYAEHALFRCGEVREHKLRQPVRFSVVPDIVNIVHTQVHFAVGFVGQVGIDDSLIQSELSSVRGYLEHIVNRWVYRTGVNL